MQLDEPLREREAEAGPFAGALRGPACLLELLEDPLLVLRSDADTRVTDGHDHIAVAPARRDPYTPPVRRELDGVREQVEKHLLHLARVGLDEIDVRCDVERHRDAVAAGALPDHRDAVLERLDEGETVDVELHPAGLDLREIEDVVDQREEVLPRAQHVVQVFSLLGVDRPEHLLDEGLGESDDRVQGSPQLVRHRREEFRLVAARDLQLAALLLYLVEEPHVLDRDGGLVDEGSHELDLAVAEGPHRVAGQHHPADHPLVAHHRDPEDGSRVRHSHHARVLEQRMRLRVGYVHGRLIFEDDTHDAELRADRQPSLTSFSLPSGSELGAHVHGERGAVRDRVEAIALGARRPGDVRAGKPRGVLGHDLEDGPEVERRLADRLQYLGDRGLPLERLLCLVEKAGVLDRDDRLPGEGLEQLDLLRRERLDLGAADRDRADRGALADQGHHEHGPVSPAALEHRADRVIAGR